MKDSTKTALGVVGVLLALFGIPIASGLYSRNQAYTPLPTIVAPQPVVKPASPPPPIQETPVILEPEPEEEYYEEEEEELCAGYPTVCEDGTCSNSTGRGTCSWHGGVWYYK